MYGLYFDLLYVIKYYKKYKREDMIQSMPIAQVRKDLSQLPDVFAAEPQPSALAVTRRGQPVLALMPWALYQGIAETLEVLGDAESCAALREGIRQIEAGEGALWEGDNP